jgi:hypothetical protein
MQFLLRHAAGGGCAVGISLLREHHERLLELCREVARICVSEEFKRLNSEMVKLYRKSGIRDASLVAFQDSLFSLIAEQSPDTEGFLEALH